MNVYELFVSTTILVAVFFFCALSTPYISAKLLHRLGVFRPLNTDFDLGNAQAIVILAADSNKYMPEYGGETVGALSLERLRYGAWLYRRTGLPILVTGGPQPNSKPPLADIMKTVLTEEFHVPVRWLETKSKNTFEHARMVSDILRADGIKEVLLVTHSFHMARSVAAFEYFGQKTIPAPTIFSKVPTPILTDFRPGPHGLVGSYFAIYEWVALCWYRYRYFRATNPRCLHMENAGDPAVAQNLTAPELVDPPARGTKNAA